MWQSKELWEAINKLGPTQPQTTHPDSVLMPDGSVSYHPDQVIRQWKQDFQELYQCSIDPGANEVDVLSTMEQWVAAWCEDYETAVVNHVIPKDDPQRSTHLATMQLNTPITLQETMNALKHAKNGKAVGIDNIPNEILKVPLLLEILHELYNMCFEKNEIPSVWYEAVNHPILKPGKSPLVSFEPQRDKFDINRSKGI